MTDTCVNCGANLSPSSTSCPSCGSPRRSPSTGNSSSGGGGGFCGSCGTTLASKYSPCPKCGHVKTTFAPPPQSGGFCGGCGGPLASKFAPCPKCGHVKTTFNPSVPAQGFLYKSSGTTNLLSILCSLLLGTNGVGHLYLGQIGKGIALMIGGWLLVAGIVVGVMLFVVPGIICGIAALIVWIWSMIDANKQCKIYNDFVAQNGRAPW